MKLQSFLMSKYQRVSQACGFLVMLVSGGALVGWFVSSPALKELRSGFIPMAPNTAFVFVLLGACLVSVGKRSLRFAKFTRLVIAVAALIVVWRMSEYLTSIELRVDHWWFRFPSESIGFAPAGKMAFLTALTFLLLSASLFLFTWPERRWTVSAGHGLSIIVAFIGLVFCLGYLYGAPLMYGGRSIPMALNTAVCFLVAGSGLVVKGSFRNIEEREAARMALQRAHDELEERVRDRTAELEAQQQYLRAIVETSPNPIFVKNAEGRFTLINKAVEAAYGRSANEILGKKEADLNGYHAEIQTFIHDDDEVIQTRQPKFIPEEELTNPKTGETRLFQTIKVPLSLPGNGAVHVLGVATDITERKQAEQALRDTEEQLRQSQKLEGVGRLAGGIAHDFNNLLTVITGFCSLAMRGLQPEDPLLGNLAEIKKAGERATSLTRQLLAFSRKQVLQPKILNLDTVVVDMEKMLHRIIGENIDLRAMLEPTLGNVNADPGQIEQIILNLVVNARDSMPSGGKLTIETDNVYLDEEYVKNHVGAQVGPHVMLAVSDTGHGMDQKTLARIFEPFFTTKELGKGTGLGLSTVYGIVKQSGGNVWVYSEVGRGTTFKIYLPRVDDGADEYQRGLDVPTVSKGSETILLVEDEEMLRKLARQTLSGYGYRIMEASNGDEAMAVAGKHDGKIHLLLTDVIMPGMTGRELGNRLLETHSRLSVLFMSGYTDDAIVHQGVLDESANFIQKPFAPESLARKVREVLDQGESLFC